MSELTQVHGTSLSYAPRECSRRREGTGGEKVLRLVGGLEDASEHPIARAIAEAARGELPAVDGFADREGLGVEGTIEGHGVIVGRPALLADWGARLT